MSTASRRRVMLDGEMLHAAELLPASNRAALTIMMNDATRQSVFVPIATLRITSDAIHALVSDHMPPFDDVSIHENGAQYPASQCVVYGHGSTCALYIELDAHGVARHVEPLLSPASPDERAAMARVLIKLGSRYELVLIDWVTMQLVDLRDETGVRTYATGR